MLTTKRNKTTKTSLGAFIKLNRVARGFSQTELASALGYTSPQFISDWEREVSSPPMKKVFELAEHLGVRSETVFELLVELSTRQLVEGLKEEFVKIKKGANAS